MIFASIDLGSSLTKVFYLNQTQSQPLIVAPEVAWIQPQQLDELAINKNAASEYSAWLQMGEEMVAVGQLAQNFGGDSGLVERKLHRAGYKVLAVLGILREKLELPTSVAAHIAVMLPITEFKDRQQLQESIKKAASGFAFRGQPLSIHLQNCLMLPEGFGLYTICKNNLKLRGIEPSTRTIFVLMFGHRNLSVLVFQNGTLQTGKSSSDGPGFFEAVKAGAQAQGILAKDYPQLLKALSLNETRIRVAGQFEGLDVQSAVTAGRTSYWKQVDSYLRNALTPVLTDENCELVISGGAAWAMRSQLIDLFERMGLTKRISWAAGLHDHMDSLLNIYPECQQDASLGLRMADAFAAFQSVVQMGKSSLAA